MNEMFYRLFRALSRMVLGLFFRRIDVEGRENVPRTGPLLLVANHANSLVDPLVLIDALGRPVTLTGKNVLAKSRFLGFLMRGLGVIAFHRKQDVDQGAKVRQNVESLRQCRKLLAGGGAVCIFPEGVSHSDPQMRPFQVGPARLALDYARKGKDAEDLTIIPVGLSYTEKDRFRSSVWLRFGLPLSVDEWVRRNPEGRQAELTAEFRRQIESRWMY
jgi:glycerol-3-phosphate O-acyltransferase/dihydroxyacetone phosphate acyltransferase